MKTATVLSVAMATLLLPVPSALAQRAGQRPSALTTFTNALNHDGFQVTPGEVGIWNLVQDWCDGKEGVTNAWYSNNEPYLQFRIPESAHERAPLNAVFQLGEDEAIVVIGLTPPSVRYFSYTPFLASKVYPDGRRPMFATLGDSVNNATIKTIGPTPFNALVVLIFTPDQGTDARVRAALKRSGYPEAMINTLVFPAPMLKLGYGDAADNLRIVPRTAIWDTPANRDAYMNNPPLQVFRVTPRTPANPNPFPAPALRVRGTGQTEMCLMNKLEELRAGIIAAHPGLVATDLPVAPGLYEGSDYIQRGADPWGDGRDCFYASSGYVPEIGTADKVTLADDEFLIVYGPNHVATGKATYMNINVYASETATETPKLSVGALDDRDFTNTTAAPYLPAGDPAAKLMFAYKVSRSGAAEPNCLPLSPPAGCARLTLDSNTILGIGIRTYLEPATGVGPAMSEILYNRVIKFSPRQ
jgi:hypothetical protein